MELKLAVIASNRLKTQVNTKKIQVGHFYSIIVPKLRSNSK